MPPLFPATLALYAVACALYLAGEIETGRG